MGIKTPGQHHPIMVRQGKGGGHIYVAPPGMEMGQLAKKLGLKGKWMDSSSLAKTYISLKFKRLGDIIGITKELFFCWTFHTPGPNNRRETYPMEFTGIFEDKVA